MRPSSIGVRLEPDDRLDVAAPFGLDDIFAMVVRPNYALDNAASHAHKAERVKAIWPEVTVLPWIVPSSAASAPPTTGPE
jgi:hypothetical protein